MFPRIICLKQTHGLLGTFAGSAPWLSLRDDCRLVELGPMEVRDPPLPLPLTRLQMASSSEPQASSAEPKKWRSMVTRKFARMQYRRDETADWEDVGDAWVKRPKADAHPERWNVQMVAIGTTGKVTLNGVEVRQYDDIYSRQVNTHGIKQLKQAYYGWKVFFPLDALYQTHLEEYERESWVENADPGAKRSIFVIRFKCMGPSTGSDASEIPKAPVVERNATDVDTKPVTTVAEDPKQPGKYPLAVMCPDFQGMFIRLAFAKGPSSAKGSAAAAKPDVWAWPMVATVLTGRPWRIVENDDNKVPLNEWARAKGHQLGTGRLREVRSGDRVEWCLEPTGGARPKKPRGEQAPAAPSGQSSHGMQSRYQPQRYERPTEFRAPAAYDTTVPRGPPAFGQALLAFRQGPLAPGQAPPAPGQAPPGLLQPPPGLHRPLPQNLGKQERDAASIPELEAMRAKALERSAQTYRNIDDLQKALRKAKEEDREARAEVLKLDSELRIRRGEP
ncbi:MAG: hypothetical protein Q9173_001368 [Seirophora scorigena]